MSTFEFRERSFIADDASFDEANAYLEEALEEAGAPMKEILRVAVAFEEVFVNVAHYAYAGSAEKGNVRIAIAYEDGVFSVSFRDDGIPFDPLAKSDPDITLPAEERGVGGLGIYMVKQTMDEVSYAYEDRQNIFTMRKRLELA